MYIALDIGATTTRMAGFKNPDNLKMTGKKVFKTSQDFEEGFKNIVGSIKEITDSPQAIGIGIAGWVENNKLTKETNIEDWIDKDLVDKLKQIFNCQIYLQNDAVAQSLAELYFDQKIKTPFLYLTLGTGLGGAIVDGKSSKNLGRAVLYKWEEKIGGKMIEERFHKTAKQLSRQEWQTVASDFKDCIMELSKTFSTDYMVLAGGIVHKQKGIFEATFKNITKPKIIFSKLGEEIGLYGGLALLKQKTS